MLVLAIWLFLIGYTVTITGKRNLGVSYVPQTDGSIKPKDDKGNDARTYSLLQVVSCAGSTPAPSVPAAASSPAGTQRPSLPGPPMTNPALRLPSLLPSLQPIQVPSPQPVPVPRPQPLPLPFDLVGGIGTFLTDVLNGLRSL